MVQSDEKTALILSGHFNEEENGCSNIWGYISFNENIFCVHLFFKKTKKILNVTNNAVCRLEITHGQ